MNKVHFIWTKMKLQIAIDLKEKTNCLHTSFDGLDSMNWHD